MAFLEIDGVEMPVPSEASYTESDIDSESTGRDSAGNLTRERLTVKIKANYGFEMLTNEEAAALRAAIAPDRISVKFGLFGSTITKDMYAGDRSYTRRTGKDIANYERWDIAFSLTEF